MRNSRLAIGVDQDSSGCIGDERAFAAIQQDEPVSPRIFDNGAPTDRNVERLHDNAPADSGDHGRGFVSRCDRDVDLQFGPLGLDHDLSVSFR